MKKVFLVGIILVSHITTIAQKTDSIKTETSKFITDKFPATRILDLQFEQFGSRNFDSKLFGGSFQNGKINNEYRFKMALNLLLLKKTNYIITTSLKYKHNHYDISDIASTGEYISLNQKNSLDYNYFFVATNFTYFSTLFKKPSIYNATLSGDGDQNGFQRVKGLLAASVILKRSPNTLIAVGLLGFIDPTTFFPVLPSFSLKQNFTNSPWGIDILLPQRIMAERSLFKNGRLSLGSELIREGFYVKPEPSFLPGTFEYSQLEVRSGFVYEQALGTKLILTFKGGIDNSIVNRLYKKNAAFSDYIYKSTQGAVAYFNAGISYNPFKIVKMGR